MNFIGKWTLENKEVCDDLINFFENSSFAKENKKKGKVGEASSFAKENKKEGVINEEIKKSTDLIIKPSNYDIIEIQNYLEELQKVCMKYVKKYQWCDRFSPWYIAEGFNIQHYEPEGGYYAWHSERVSAEFPVGTRHLVFMTYLNDVTDCGETEWFYQKTKIKPKKGLTAIWPADWTHVHRGIASPTQHKYIATGWYNYCLPKTN